MSNQYIKHLSSLDHGELAVFCGAGISRNSGLPTANELKKGILKKLPLSHSEVDKIMEWTGPFESFMEMFSDTRGFSIILDIFKLGTPNTNHIFIARLLKAGLTNVIATTNFDNLIEKALESKELGLKRNQDFNVLITEEELENFQKRGSNLPIVLKLHGSIDNLDSIAITLKAVANQVNRENIQNIIENLFSSGSHQKILIVGYSCSDRFDIIPSIQAVQSNRKEVFMVEHNDKADTIDPKNPKNPKNLKNLKNPFIGYKGIRYVCRTESIVKHIWKSNESSIGEFRELSSNVDREKRLGKKEKEEEEKEEWEKRLDEWDLGLQAYERLYLAGHIFRLIGEIERAEKYYKYTLDLSQGTDNETGIIDALIGMANIYADLGAGEKSQIYSKDAIELVKKRLMMIDKSPSSSDERSKKIHKDILLSHEIIQKLSKAQNIPENIIPIQNEIIENRQLLPSEIREYCYINKGIQYNNLKGYKLALKFFNKAKDMASSNGHLEILVECYIGLGDLYYSSQRKKKASKHYNKSLELATDINNKRLIDVSNGRLKKIAQTK